MEALRNPWFIAPFVVGVVGLVALVFTFFKAAESRPGWKAWIIFAAPSLLMLMVFYSLAVHMHQTMGGWPAAIGTNGFPARLIVHAQVTMWCFYILFMITLFLWPFFFLVSVFSRGFGLAHLGIHAVSFAVCFGTMLLAPAPFLYWWWD